jgi:hypothetical protein
MTISENIILTARNDTRTAFREMEQDARRATEQISKFDMSGNQAFAGGLNRGSTSLRQFGDMLVSAADKAGLGTAQIRKMADATGIFSDEQLWAATSAGLMQSKASQLAQAVADGSLTTREAGAAFRQYANAHVTSVGAVDQLKGSVGALWGTIGGMVTSGLLLAAGQKIIQFGKDSLAAADDAARTQAQLNAVIRSTGGAAGVTAEGVNALAGALSGLTGVDDDLIIQNEALMLTFKNVGEDVFSRANQAALDMSAVMKQDLQSSVIQVGKALNEPVEGAGALRRVGVQLTDQQEEMIEAFVKSGDVLSAQKVILEELESEFGGAAEAMHNAGGGADALAVSVGNLKEAFGADLMPAVKEARGELEDWVDGLTGAISAETALKAAEEEGIITWREAQEQLNRMMMTSYSAGDVMAWLAEREGEVYGAERALGDTRREGIELLRGYAATVAEAEEAQRRWDEALRASGGGTMQAYQAMERYSAELALADEALGRMGQRAMEAYRAMERFSAAGALAAEQREKIGSLLDMLDRDVGSPIGGFIKDLEWLQAGGWRINAAFEALKAGLASGEISPAEAQSFAAPLFVAAQDLQVELDMISGEEAEKNLMATLGVSLTTAKTMIEGTDGISGALDRITGTEYVLNFRFNYQGALPEGFGIGGGLPPSTTLPSGGGGGGGRINPGLLGGGMETMIPPGEAGAAVRTPTGGPAGATLLLAGEGGGGGDMYVEQTIIAMPGMDVEALAAESVARLDAARRAWAAGAGYVG